MDEPDPDHFRAEAMRLLREVAEKLVREIDNSDEWVHPATRRAVNDLRETLNPHTADSPEP